MLLRNNSQQSGGLRDAGSTQVLRDEMVRAERQRARGQRLMESQGEEVLERKDLQEQNWCGTQGNKTT